MSVSVDVTVLVSWVCDCAVMVVVADMICVSVAGIVIVNVMLILAPTSNTPVVVGSIETGHGLVAVIERVSLTSPVLVS